MNYKKIVRYIKRLPIIAMVLSLLNLVISILSGKEFSTAIIIFVCMVAIYNSISKKDKIRHQMHM